MVVAKMSAFNPGILAVETNSEMFEKVARREISAHDAAAQLLAADTALRKQKVAAARPKWVPSIAWAIIAVIVVALIDSLRQRTS